MAVYNIENQVFCTICQKCNAKPTKTPLADLELTPGVVFVPDIVYCANCGAQLTLQVRSLFKAELEEKKNPEVGKVISSLSQPTEKKQTTEAENDGETKNQG